MGQTRDKVDRRGGGVVQRPGGGDRIQQTPGLETDKPEAAQGVWEEQTVVERGDFSPVGSST